VSGSKRPALIKMWLRAPIEERDATEPAHEWRQGKHARDPPSASQSPLLANIYMNVPEALAFDRMRRHVPGSRRPPIPTTSYLARRRPATRQLAGPEDREDHNLGMLTSTRGPETFAGERKPDQDRP